MENVYILFYYVYNTCILLYFIEILGIFHEVHFAIAWIQIS